MDKLFGPARVRFRQVLLYIIVQLSGMLQLDNSHVLKIYIVFVVFLKSFTVTTVYPKAAKLSIPCAPLHSLNGSTVIVAAVELLAIN